MKQIDHLLPSLQSRYDLKPIARVSPLTGGEWKTLWRLEGAQASYVVSISHPTTLVESVAYEHRLLRYLGLHLPQVPMPLMASDGSSYFVEQGRIVCLLPLMPGVMADGDQIYLAAARFLARFHQVGVNHSEWSPRPGVPAWREWDWHATAWPAIETMLATLPKTTDPIGQRFWQSCGEWAGQIAAHRAQIVQERTHFQRWIADLAQSERCLTVGLIHDDFHGNNLLVEGETITALLDWDSCHPDWLLFDLSNATWEFCHDDDTHSLVVKEAQAFLQAYAAADGPVTATEFALIIPFIRCRRMIEILTALRGIATGEAWDESPDYLVHNLLSLENLRGIRL